MYERCSYEKIKEKENASKYGKTESDSQCGHPSVRDNFEIHKLSTRSNIQQNVMKDRGKEKNRLPLANSKEEVKMSNNSNSNACALIENSRPNKVYRHPPIIDDEIDDMSSEDFN